MSHAAQSPDNGSDSRSASQHTSTSQRQTRKPWIIGIVAAFVLAAAITIGVFAFQGNNASQQRNSGGATSSQTTPATQSDGNGSDTSNKGQGSSAGTDTQNQNKPQIKETAPSEPGEGDASVDFSDGTPAQ